MTTVLPFEPNRFRTAAAHYLEGRPAYPAALIERVAEICRLAPADRVLDLGCGPGQLARAFSPMVAEVLGVDPEPEMLRIARDASAGYANVAFREASSYDLTPEWGKFRLVCMGRSFHWMDRADTLRRLEAMVPPDGAIVLFADSHPTVPDNAWYAAFRAIVDRYAEGDGSHRQIKGPDWVPHEAVLLGSAFCRLESVGVYERHRLDAATLTARALSASVTSRARLGDRADAMVAEVAAILPPDGGLEVVLGTALIARRPWRR